MTLQDIERPIITTFVDDFNIFASVKNEIMKRIKEKLATTFDMVDIGPLGFYIGLKVTRDHKQKIIKLSQPGYIEELLD